MHAAAPVALAVLRSHIGDQRLRVVRVQMAWHEIVPHTLLPYVWPSDLKGDSLVVHVADNQWLHELRYLETDLLARIQEACPSTAIASLRMRLGAVPKLSERPKVMPLEKVAAAWNRDLLSPQPSPETLEALEDVDDVELRHAVANARMALSQRRDDH